jgi:hypothetical protein
MISNAQALALLGRPDPARAWLQKTLDAAKYSRSGGAP